MAKLLSEITEFHGDPAPLAVLHRLCFPDPWDGKAIADLLTGPGTFAFATDDGFVLVRIVADEATEIFFTSEAVNERSKSHPLHHTADSNSAGCCQQASGKLLKQTRLCPTHGSDNHSNASFPIPLTASMEVVV